MKRFWLVLVSLVLVSCGDGSIALNGEACTNDEDCENNICLERLNSLEFPGGLCTNNCDIEDDSTCSGNEICLIHVWTQLSHCYPLCETDDDCRADEGYSCYNLGDDEGEEPLLVCLPPL